MMPMITPQIVAKKKGSAFDFLNFFKYILKDHLDFNLYVNFTLKLIYNLLWESNLFEA